MMHSEDVPEKLADALLHCPKNFFPGIHSLIQIFLAVSVSSATAERIFSALRKIKSYLRSTMGEERLSGLATLYIHCKINMDLDPIRIWIRIGGGGGVGQPNMCIPPGKILGTPLTVPYRCITRIDGTYRHDVKKCRVRQISLYLFFSSGGEKNFSSRTFFRWNYRNTLNNKLDAVGA
jgi:hypothetical protein